MDKTGMAIAFAIKKKNMQKGLKPDAEMVEKVMAKHMNYGGMAKYSEGGEVKGPNFQHPEYMHERKNESQSKRMIRAMMATRSNYSEGGEVEPEAGAYEDEEGKNKPYLSRPVYSGKSAYKSADIKQTDEDDLQGFDEHDTDRKYIKLAMGGMVDADDTESMSEAPDFYDPDFLSDEEQDHAINLTYPDPDHVEDSEGMLGSIMKKIRMRNMGK